MVRETLEIISLNTPSWMADALCGNGDYDPEDWFPKAGDEEYSAKAERAQQVCRKCPVKTQCLRWAYDIDDAWAVLGATTAKQRSHVKSRMRRKWNEWQTQGNNEVQRNRSLRL